MWFVENISQPAEAPAEFPSRIVGRIPQEVTKSAAPRRAGGEGKIGKERPGLA
jgi:hypothetical protein